MIRWYNFVDRDFDSDALSHQRLKQNRAVAHSPPLDVATTMALVVGLR